MTILKLFDGLVSHNSKMTEWLRQNGYKGKVVNLDAFDYLVDSPKVFNEQKLNGSVKLFYAGNLSESKVPYIYDKALHDIKRIKLNVYGQGFETDKNDNACIDYKGIFDPGMPDLPENYHFGLIWEGSGLDTCSGHMGHYIRFNNPHKFSLYMSLGLPIIVWEEAAIADFVLKNKIGLTIKSFYDLENIGGKITPEEYGMYTDNIRNFAQKVRSGYFLKTALNTLVNS